MGPDYFPDELQPIINQPIKINIPTADGSHREMVLADGGSNDGTGIPALVQRRVRKIIGTVFWSAQEWLFDVKPYAAGMDVMMSPFFGLSFYGNQIYQITCSITLVTMVKTIFQIV
jgi:hypothetical protein